MKTYEVTIDDWYELFVAIEDAFAVHPAQRQNAYLNGPTPLLRMSFNNTEAFMAEGFGWSRPGEDRIPLAELGSHRFLNQISKWVRPSNPKGGRFLVYRNGVEWSGETAHLLFRFSGIATVSSATLFVDEILSYIIKYPHSEHKAAKVADVLGGPRFRDFRLEI